MKSSWKFLVLIYPSLILSTPLCNPEDNCTCYPGTDLEVQCPRDASKGERFVIHIKSRTTIKIDCYDMTNFRVDLLPNITSEEESRLELSSCPLPTGSFKEIVDRFSMNGTKVVQFESSNRNVTLSRKYFEGLDLDRLRLSVLNFTHIEDDVFDGLSNLYSLEMDRNRNLTLTPRFFQNLTKLHELFLPKNGMEAVPAGLFDTLTSLSRLHLWSNNLKAIEEDAFSGLTNLTSLDMNTNRIENISERAFQNLTKLKSVNLSGNRLGILSFEMFKNNQNISTIFLNHNPGLRIPDYFFAHFKSLANLDLSHCNLSSIPEHTFENSTNLQAISLEKNKLTKIPSILFRGLVNLKILNLRNNLIDKIDGNMFRDLSSLEKIDLAKNRISEIDHRTFYGKTRLIIIDLSYNKYPGSGSTLNILEDAPAVTKLDFSHNLLTKIADVVSPHSMSRLEEFNLSHNDITEIWLTDLQSSVDMKVCLDHNEITRIRFDNIEDISGSGKTTISLSDNAIACTCDNFELVQFLNGEKYEQKLGMFRILTEDLICESPDGRMGEKVEDLQPSALGCDLEQSSSGCPGECSCSWRPFDTSVVIDCQNKNLSEFPILDHRMKNMFAFNQTELHLEGNNLETGPSVNLEGYNNVTRLYLSNNRIKRIDWLPPKLNVLHVDNNQLSFLSANVLDSLNKSNLFNLTLHNNHWTCDCNSVNLTIFLSQHSRLTDVNKIHCHKDTKLLINLTEANLCDSDLIVYILIAFLGIILFFMILLVLFYQYQQEIKVWLFAHDLLLCWVTAEELDKDKTYDAFISYSHLDENFVVEKLVPELESGPTPYKLCLHFRDWIPGEFIPTQVTNTVLQSRRTLIVLSPNFLESFWGKLEFRTAHMHAMTEGRTRVVIVVYGDVDIDKLDDELKAYMKTNTYVKWGDPYFWDKLKYALPHHKAKASKQTQKLVNVMNCIDDKLTLVRVDKSSPGTTPPVLSLEINNLKKHPLDFVHGQEVTAPRTGARSLIIT